MVGHVDAVQCFQGIPAILVAVFGPPRSRRQLAHPNHIEGGDGKTPIDVDVLRDITDAVGRLLRRRAHDSYPSIVRFKQSQHQFEHGGLAAAVGADHGHEIAFPDGPIDAFQDPLSVKRKIDIFHLNDGQWGIGVS